LVRQLGESFQILVFVVVLAELLSKANLPIDKIQKALRMGQNLRILLGVLLDRDSIASEPALALVRPQPLKELR
jgi:hypothetical protein